MKRRLIYTNAQNGVFQNNSIDIGHAILIVSVKLYTKMCSKYDIYVSTRPKIYCLSTVCFKTVSSHLIPTLPNYYLAISLYMTDILKYRI